MDNDSIGDRLSVTERETFDREGFIVVRNALSERECAAIGAIASRHDAGFRCEAGIGGHHILNEHDLVGKEAEWLEVIDNPSVFAKVVDIMGWNIQLFHTQLLVTPPAPNAAVAGPYGWHQDNNRMNRDLGRASQPMVSLKVGYFITPIPRPGMGNLCVIPRSHSVAPEPSDNQTGFRGSAEWPMADPEYVEFVADAGDAVIFDRRLWHSASTNVSDTTRIFVTFGYSYRWLRPKSAMNVDALLESSSAIRRQLLGWATSANGYFDPTPADVPLREWIRTNRGDAFVAP